MNYLEHFAISIVMGILQQTVKNPKHAAALRTQLLGVASDIFLAYGITPPEIPDASPAA